MQLLQRLVVGVLGTVFGKGLLLWLESKDVYLDRDIASLLGLVESSISTNQGIYLMLLGIFGLFGFAVGPSLIKEIRGIWSKLQEWFRRQATSGSHKPTNMTAREALEWIARESKWAWRHRILSSREKVIAMGPMEFDRAAREGRISVRGHGCTSGGYKTIDRDYWNTAGLDVLDIMNPLGSSGRSQPKTFVDVEPLLDLLVCRQQVMSTWPRAGRLSRCYFRLLLSAQRYKSMAIGKYLNLSEAQKKKLLTRFTKQHPSTGDEDEFDHLLDNMAKKPESEDQTSDSSRRRED